MSIGTLFAFVLVSAGVIILRKTRPDLDRSFRVPAVPIIPILSILTCTWLMLNLSAATWLRFLVWLAIGFVIYFTYGASHSRLSRGLKRARTKADSTMEVPRLPGE